MGIKFGGLLLLVGLSGCSEKVSQCTTNTDCQNPAYPFCDVNGTYAPSDGDKNVCTIVPPDCPIDVCGCSPGAVTCAASELTTCNTDGMSTTSDACALGCATTNDRCLTFTPANGLGPALTAAAAEPAVVFPSQVTINTDTGQVRDAGGVLVSVSALTVTQPGGVSIEVLIAKSFDITNATVTGANALALVSVGNISIHGIVNMSANMNTAGPGAMTTGGCVGIANVDLGGGGGNATDGGEGGGISTVAAGGAMQQGYEPLQGGCNGGAAMFGGGGGALQLDSLGTIDLGSAATLNLGGGGSVGPGGGGSGGNALIEAPTVTVEGNVVGNGGGAGSSTSGCTSVGGDARTDSQPAAGGSCGATIRSLGGTGGTRASPPERGVGLNGSGGGGGAIGRLHVRTQTGSYDHATGTIGLDDSSEALVLH